MQRDDGGPAFPPNAGWRDDDPAARGMSLRDYFAAAAMQGYLASMRSSDELTIPEVARDAYRYADAMIEARRE